MQERIHWMTTLVGLLLMPLALAASESEVKVLDGNFDVQRSQIEESLSGNEAYSEISAQNRRTVMALLERMGATLRNVDGLDSLQEHERIRLLNDQEQINGILTKARADSRLVCRRETPVGTRRSQTNCMTVEQRRLAAEASQEQFNRRFVPATEQPN